MLLEPVGVSRCDLKKVFFLYYNIFFYYCQIRESAYADRSAPGGGESNTECCYMGGGVIVGKWGAYAMPLDAYEKFHMWVPIGNSDPHFPARPGLPPTSIIPQLSPFVNRQFAQKKFSPLKGEKFFIHFCNSIVIFCNLRDVDERTACHVISHVNASVYGSKRSIVLF